MDQELIQVGDFELEPRQLVEIAKSFADGNSAIEVSQSLGIAVGDLLELINTPEIFDKAILAQKKMLELLVLGPIADRMLQIASNGGDARNAVSAAKFLKDLTGATSTKDLEKIKPSVPATNSMTVILANGGYDTLVREVARVQDQVKSVGNIPMSAGDYEIS